MNNVTKMLITLTLIGSISGLSLFLVSDWAEPLIAANRKAETERAIFVVHPDGKAYEDLSSLMPGLFKVLDENKNSKGYSLSYSGNGFQGKIVLMVGLNDDLNKISAIEILEQVETPGLGTKVTETEFTKQFNNLNTLPNVGWVKGAPPSKPNEIQTITGATISSKAVVNIINDGLKHLRELKQKGLI